MRAAEKFVGQARGVAQQVVHRGGWCHGSSAHLPIALDGDLLIRKLGQILATGSLSSKRPCSTSIMTATETTGLVME